MNETETRAEHIDPALAAAGWGVVEDSRIRREYPITQGRIEGHGRRGKALKADYVLEYRNTKLAVVEAKAWDKPLTEGVGQAKEYATKLIIRFTYATNGQGIYSIDMESGVERELVQYPTPEELWQLTFAAQNAWRDRFSAVPFSDKSGSWVIRFYQEIAVNNVLEKIVSGLDRILLTLATGTGKTSIAFQIAWKLFQARWNLKEWRFDRLSDRSFDESSSPNTQSRRPRILFLADRNNLANQAYNDFTSFNAFSEDALVRISPDEIRKRNKVPKNGNIFFTIFQTFASTGSATAASTGSATAASTGSATAASPDTASRQSTNLQRDIRAHFEEITVIDDAYGYMYILECADGSLYTGSTRDLRTRMNQHNSHEGAKHTKARLPVKLIYYETFSRIDEAFEREKQVQGWSRAKKDAVIDGNIDLLQQLSHNKSFDHTPDNLVESFPEPFELARGRTVESVPEPVESVPEPVEGYFGDYPPDFFDFIIIDECHRGGANDESRWRGILEYFSPAVQLGLTLTLTSY